MEEISERMALNAQLATTTFVELFHALLFKYADGFLNFWSRTGFHSVSTGIFNSQHSYLIFLIFFCRLPELVAAGCGLCRRSATSGQVPLDEAAYTAAGTSTDQYLCEQLGGPCIVCISPQNYSC
jgi:hypothetical protein